MLDLALSEVLNPKKTVTIEAALESAGIILRNYSVQSGESSLHKRIFASPDSFSLSYVWYALSELDYRNAAFDLLSMPGNNPLQLQTAIAEISANLSPQDALVLRHLAQRSGIVVPLLPTPAQQAIQYEYWGGTDACASAEKCFAEMLSHPYGNGVGILMEEANPLAIIKDDDFFGDRKVGLLLEPVTVGTIQYEPGFILQLDYDDLRQVRLPSRACTVDIGIVKGYGRRPSSFIFDNTSDRRNGFGTHYELQNDRAGKIDLDTITLENFKEYAHLLLTS